MDQKWPISSNLGGQKSNRANYDEPGGSWLSRRCSWSTKLLFFHFHEIAPFWTRRCELPLEWDVKEARALPAGRRGSRGLFFNVWDLNNVLCTEGADGSYTCL